jgi:hypothetical protein
MKFKIKDLLDDDESDEHAQSVGKEVARRLKASKTKGLSGVDEFDVDDFVDEFENVETCEEFNWVLDRFYDFADAQKIWVE